MLKILKTGTLPHKARTDLLGDHGEIQSTGRYHDSRQKHHLSNSAGYVTAVSAWRRPLSL